MQTAVAYAIAAFCEIAGCYAFWSVVRLDRSPIWLAAGIVCLLVFAYSLTFVGSASAGRAFAAYGGLYIAASLAWLWLVEGKLPDRWDLIGGVVCLTGAAIVIAGPR